MMIFFLGMHMWGRANKQQELSNPSPTPPGAEGQSRPRWGLLDACLAPQEDRRLEPSP